MPNNDCYLQLFTFSVDKLSGQPLTRWGKSDHKCSVYEYHVMPSLVTS